METVEDEHPEANSLPQHLETQQESRPRQSTGSMRSGLSGLSGLGEESAPRATRQGSWRSFTSRKSLGGAPEACEIVYKKRPSSLLARSTTKASLARLFSSKESEPTRKLQRLSRAPTSSSTASSSSVDWRSQKVVGHGLLEPEGAVRPKASYLVVTSRHIIRLHSQNDALALFPELGSETPVARLKPATETPLIIPLCRVVSAFRAESSRPSFGIEIWWASETTAGFSRADFFFSVPRAREDLLRAMHRVLVREVAAQHDGQASIAPEIEAHLTGIALSQDAQYAHQKPELFPVVLRRLPRGPAAQGFAELPWKTREGPGYYLVISANLALVVEVSKGPARSGQDTVSKFYKMGLAALETFGGHWTGPEERFVVRFRVPWEQPCSVELASKHCRQIVLTLLKADRAIKSAWPHFWRHQVTFRVQGLSQYAPGVYSSSASISEKAYEGFQRTLDGLLVAYGCSPVEWDTSFQGHVTPEFRLLPALNGELYSPLQLVAVLRALRYVTCFKALSFRNIDLSGLSLLQPGAGPDSVAFLSLTGRKLGPELFLTIEKATVLHQEVHALAFCSERIERLDFTNCLVHRRRTSQGMGELPSKLPFLAPILDLMRNQLTSCTNLVLDGNVLGLSDIDQLAKTLQTPEARLTGLSVSDCRLKSGAVQILAEALSRHSQTLQELDISLNTSSMSASTLITLLAGMPSLVRLNVCGSVMGTAEGPLLTSSSLKRMSSLRDLDLSGVQVDENSIESLVEYFATTPSSPLRCLCLNGCRITGFGFARLFEAVHHATGGDSLSITLNSNPLEQGVGRLARAIRSSSGPSILHMDMVEFREDNSYAQLLKAIALSSKITMLSLVGTGPTSGDGRETTEVFKSFFATNRTIRCLDLSGYSGKLDEGQLGGHFGLSLDWLCKNQTLTHLGVRNQNLNEHRAQLARVLEQNDTLRFLDLEENNFSLTTLRFLAASLTKNHSLLAFPLSKAEQQRIWRRQLRDLNLVGLGSPSSQASVTALREVFEQQIAAIGTVVDRNRREIEQASGRRINYTPLENFGTDWPSLDLVDAGSAGQSSLHCSAVLVDCRERHPYRVTLSEVEAGSDATSPTTSEVPASPSWAGPSTPEDDGVAQLIGRFEEAGFTKYGDK